MGNYELTFHITPLSDGLVDDLYDAFDCLVGTDHAGQGYITVTAPGEDAVHAAKTMATQLVARFGLTVLRTQHDLVDRQEIADRLGLTRQAVGAWVRGERGTDFPSAFNEVSGGVWLWHDVRAWAIANGRPIPDPEVDYPSRDDHDTINGYLVNKCVSPAAATDQQSNVVFRVAMASTYSMTESHVHSWIWRHIQVSEPKNVLR